MVTLNQAATVRHVRKRDGKYLVGVGFDELPELVRAEIISWIHRIETEVAQATAATAGPAVN